MKFTPLLAVPETVMTHVTGRSSRRHSRDDARISPSLLPVAVVPLNLTVLVPWLDPKWLPVMVTEVPSGPDVVDKLVILGPAA